MAALREKVFKLINIAFLKCIVSDMYKHFDAKHKFVFKVQGSK